MKKKILLAPAILTVLISAAFLAWLFSLHGTRGLLHVEMVGWVAVIVIAVTALIPLVLWFIQYRQGKKSPVLAAAVIGLSVISIIIPVFGYTFINGFPSPPPIDITPRLIVAGAGVNGIPDIAVSFMSTKPARSTLTWGRDEISRTLAETSAAVNHTFVLPDLDPGKQYWYRIDGGTTYYFSTPDTDNPLHFAVGSDAHFGAGDNRPDITDQMLTGIAAPADNFDYFFFLGDMVELGFRTEEWQDALSTFAKAAPNLPVAYAPGNHDALFTGLGRYLEYCCPESIDFGNGNRLWHRFDIGSVHFLVLDMEWSAETFTPARQSWLEDELKSIPPDDWTVVLNHGFYYGSGSVTRGWEWWDNPEVIELITPLFEKYGVDLVFSGHAHQMELLAQNGVSYVIAGAFGGIPDSEPEYVSPASLWYASGQYGFVDVTIGADQADIVFKDQDGQVLHAASVAK